MENHNKRIKFHLNDKELNRLDRDAKRLGLSRSAYVRHLVSTIHPKPQPKVSYKEYLPVLQEISTEFEQIAEKAEHAPAEKTRGNHHQRLCRCKEALDQMRYRDADEGDRSRKGRDACGQQTGQEYQLNAESLYVHSHVTGVLLPQLIGTHGL